MPINPLISTPTGKALSAVFVKHCGSKSGNKGGKSEVWIAYLGRKGENYLMPWSDLFVYSLDLLHKQSSLGSLKRLQGESSGSWVITVLYGAELR